MEYPSWTRDGTRTGDMLRVIRASDTASIERFSRRIAERKPTGGPHWNVTYSEKAENLLAVIWENRSYGAFKYDVFARSVRRFPLRRI